MPSQELDQRQHAADVSLINRRSVKTWCSLLPRNKNFNDFYYDDYFPEGLNLSERKCACFLCFNEWAEGGTYVSVILKSSLFWQSLNGFFKRPFECLAQLCWKQLWFEAGTLPCLFMFNIVCKNSITSVFSRYPERCWYIGWWAGLASPLLWKMCQGTQTSPPSWGWVKSWSSSCHTDGIFRHHGRDKTPLTNRRENFTAVMLLSPSTWRLPSSPRLSAPVRQSSVTSLICSHCSWNPWLLVPSATAMERRPFSSSWRWYFKGLKDLAVKQEERQVWHSSSDT